MKGQPHLIVSPEPLTAGKDYVSLCRKEIISAVWVWQVVERGQVVDRLRTCTKCWERLRPDDVTEYVYGAISRSDVKEENDEAA